MQTATTPPRGALTLETAAPVLLDIVHAVVFAARMHLPPAEVLDECGPLVVAASDVLKRLEWAAA